MNRWLAVGLLAAVEMGSAQSTPGSLEAVAWLAGCWELRRTDRVTVEMWMPPAGGLMVGGSRTVVAGRARAFEHLQIRAEGDGLVYVATPSGQQETEFRSVSVTDDGFVVENPEHDFPQRIVYRRNGADSLIARIEGPGPTGPRGIDFPMRRIRCAGSEM